MSAVQQWFIFAFFLVASGISLWIYMVYARKKSILDIPNDRSSHSVPIVRGAGLAVLPSILLAGAMAYLSPKLGLGSWSDIKQEIFLSMGLVLGGVIGFLDDRFTLSNRVRLPLYTLATLLVTNFGSFQVLPWLLGLFVLIVLTGSVNTYNFMDGINGITVLYSAVLVFFGWYAFNSTHAVGQGLEIMLLAIGAFLVVFSTVNLRKNALAFLGDSGSVLLGLLAVFLVFELGTIYETWTSLILLLVYGVDSVGTIIMRLMRRENIFKAHRSHLYQDLVHVKKWSHLKTAIVYALVQILLNAFWLFSIRQENHEIFFTTSLGILILVYVWSKFNIGTLNLKHEKP